jgi:hypothetical protein
MPASTAKQGYDQLLVPSYSCNCCKYALVLSE